MTDSPLPVQSPVIPLPPNASAAQQDMAVKLKVGESFMGLYEPSRFKAFYGGRGSAKSHNSAEAALFRTIGNNAYRVVCGRQFQNSIAESSKFLIEEKIKAFGYSSLFKITEYTIENVINGSHFIFIGLDRNPDSMKSLEGADLFLGEEAQTFSQRSLDLLVPTMRRKDSELWFLWNPFKARDAVDNMFRGPTFVPSDDTIVRFVSWRDNIFFKKSPLMREMERMRDRDRLKYRHVWEGDYEKVADSQVFKNYRIGVREVPEHVTPIIGADWGYSNDPTAVTKSYLLDGGDTLYVEAEAGGVGIPIESTPDLFDKIPGTRTFTITADNARPEMIDFMGTKGFRVEAAKKGANSVKDGIVWLQSRQIVIHPSCKKTAQEFDNFSWKIDRDGTILPVYIDEWNHYLDSIRYASESERAPKPTFRSIRF